jgi:hypothetical protein
MNRRLVATMFAIVVLAGALVPNAVADQDNKAILFSVDAPVEIPGAMLGPGRYEVKLQGDGSSIAGVWSADGSQFYGFFDTALVNRSHAGPSKVVLTNSEKNTAQQIAEWFYSGDRTGNKLLYPSKSDVHLVSATSMRQETGR